MSASCFIEFKESVKEYELPVKFTFPFYYEPHPLSILAAKELQEYLQTQNDWEHNFGIDLDLEGLIIGKMFGVLVVKDSDGRLGYLAAFSGKLANSNDHRHFVPPVFDILSKDSFFRVGEKEVSAINTELELLENSTELSLAREIVQKEIDLYEAETEKHKSIIKENKAARKLQRKAIDESATIEEKETKLESLRSASIKEQTFLKYFHASWKERISKVQEQLNVYESKLEELREARRTMSSALQQEIFEAYSFLNQYGERKSLNTIFGQTIYQQPPAGAGECAAPKLLQYAYLNNLKPISIAEFWWGQSPSSEVRKHGHFYPACRGKCEPILGHMLQGLDVDENPLLTNPALRKSIEIVYEDEYLVVINKPEEFLSVPGINIEDSVQFRMRELYPNATGPLTVHRLDMSTSGLMLIAKSQEVHKDLQRQFIRQAIKKRYVALLDGIVKYDSGTIDLPLRLDIDDRPRQLVCYEHGKPAITEYKVIVRLNGQTRIHFFPKTGRTHQLRVHASHKLGLNAPIVGDDLYGTKSNRLHLHAESLEFKHPVTKEMMVIEKEAGF